MVEQVTVPTGMVTTTARPDSGALLQALEPLPSLLCLVFPVFQDFVVNGCDLGWVLRRIGFDSQVD